MRSRTARLATGAVAWIAIVAAAFLLFQSDKQAARFRSAGRAFDLRAREATDLLAELRVAEEAYVAEGQGAGFWMTKVSTISTAVGEAVASLRQSARSAPARAALDEASVSLTEFGSVDKRVRDYLRSGQPLMAGDVIFTEGGETAAVAGRHVEAARIAERQVLEVDEAAIHRQQALALGGAAVIVALVVLVLGALGVQNPDSAAQAGVGLGIATSISAAGEPQLQRDARPATPGRAAAPALREAAQLCTEFGRVRDLTDLQMLAGRTAALMDASGLIVWLGSLSGADLRPVLAHGYPPQTLGRMPSVPRSDDNAAAAAYRTGELQIVLARPGSPSGAVVAPILSSDGCVGALSAEIRGGAEASEIVQSLAVLFAAQLAAVLASPPASDAGRDRVVATS